MGLQTLIDFTYMFFVNNNTTARPKTVKQYQYFANGFSIEVMEQYSLDSFENTKNSFGVMKMYSPCFCFVFLNNVNTNK